MWVPFGRFGTQEVKQYVELPKPEYQGFEINANMINSHANEGSME